MNGNIVIDKVILWRVWCVAYMDHILLGGTFNTHHWATPNVWTPHSHNGDKSCYIITSTANWGDNYISFFWANQNNLRIWLIIVYTLYISLHNPLRVLGFVFFKNAISGVILHFERNSIQFLRTRHLIWCDLKLDW